MARRIRLRPKAITAVFVVAVCVLIVFGLVRCAQALQSPPDEPPGTAVSDKAMTLRASGSVNGQFIGRLSPTHDSVCELLVSPASAFFHIRGYFEKVPGYVEIYLGPYTGPGTYRLPAGGSRVELGVREPNHQPNAMSGLIWTSTQGTVTLTNIAGPAKDDYAHARAQGALDVQLASTDSLNTRGGQITLEGDWVCDGTSSRQ